VLITIFGVLNTIIAGLVAYLKSRGPPMPARMFRDDLENVVKEIENSKTMWLGIKNEMHGYDEIDVDDKFSVRSEVVRLTRIYESAIKKYKQNNPDIYSMGGGMLDAVSGLRARLGVIEPPEPTMPAPDADAALARGADESSTTITKSVISDNKGKEKDEEASAAKDPSISATTDAAAKGKSKETDAEPASTAVPLHGAPNDSRNSVNDDAKAST
jgi:SMODS and SLOG-associating 2TM effector domain